MTITSAPPLTKAPVRLRGTIVLTFVTLAWGAFSFGAVYPWAYWPLAIAAQTIGFAGLYIERRSSAGGSRLFVVALALIAAAGLMQLIPLDVGTLDAISPKTTSTLKEFDAPFANGLIARRALSLVPAATWTALALFGSFALLLVGSARLASVGGADRMVSGIAIVSVMLALAGIIQQPLYNGKIYGFWTTQMGGNPYGPFVNKNHFAGWMLMALPLTLGLFCAGVARGMRGVRPALRERVLWLSSPDANKLLLLAMAAAIMALSLVLTFSRSGMSGAIVAVSLMLGVIVRRGGSRASRALAGAYLTLLVIIVVAWVGAAAIGQRFASADWSELNDRRGAWADAWSIAKAFPLAGTGLNTYGYATLFYQKHGLEQHFAQAHNDYLQLAAEGGLLLAMPIVFALVVFCRDVRRRFREDAGSSVYWIRTGAVIGLIAIGLQESVEFSLQMPGNAAIFAVTCGIALHKAPARRAERPLAPGDEGLVSYKRSRTTDRL